MANPLRIVPSGWTLCLLAFAAAGTSASEWPQWRGSARDGHAPALGGLVEGSKTRSLWTIEVGEGQASPVLADGRVVLLDRLEDEERVSAYDLESGEQLWSFAEPVRFKAGMGGGRYGGGPKSTPAIADGHVVTYGVKSVLAVRNLETGEQLWRKDLHEDHNDPTLYWGNSMSPIVVEGRVVVQYGNAKRGGVLAFDLKSGERLWSIEGYGSSYSSPVLYRGAADVDHVVLMTYEGPVGVSLDGKVLWTIDAPMTFSRQNTATPVLAGDLLIFGSGGKPLRAHRLSFSDGRWSTEQVWSKEELSIDMASPVAFDGKVCAVVTQKKGQLVCLETATGAELYRSAARFDDYAVLLVTGDNLLVVRPEGELLALRRDATAFDVETELSISSSEIWAHPAVLADGLVVKSFDRLERLALESDGTAGDLR
ncbi:MAG: PQQ-binding-like beta-propeller repeat protein [Acidobacteriota bacterium]